MKKIPTLFEREYSDHKVVGIKPILTSPDLQWVLDGEGIATEKIDGSCCAIIDGKFYRRYDAKKGKKPPENAIPCCDPDPITGHWPHWIPVDITDPSSMWFIKAYDNSTKFYKYSNEELKDGTYEAIGPHFQGNPHHVAEDMLIRHGRTVIDIPDRSFESIKEYLKNHVIEGIVFWKDNEPMCKIKRSDFGFKWPV